MSDTRKRLRKMLATDMMELEWHGELEAARAALPALLDVVEALDAYEHADANAGRAEAELRLAELRHARAALARLDGES